MLRMFNTFVALLFSMAFMNTDHDRRRLVVASRSAAVHRAPTDRMAETGAVPGFTADIGIAVFLGVSDLPEYLDTIGVGLLVLAGLPLMRSKNVR